MDCISVAIAENLEFDMARIAKVFLDINRGIAKCGLRLVAGLAHQGFEAVFAFANLHSASAAAACCLDYYRITDLCGDFPGLRRVGYRAVRSRNQRQAKRARSPLRFDLVAHSADVFWLWTDPDDVVRLDDLGELGVFGQETIARMDRIAPGDLCRGDDVGVIEVTLRRRGRTDAYRVIGKPDVHGIGIGGRMYRHRLDPHFVRGAMYSKRDFAAIGDQDARNFHNVSCPQPMTTSGWSNSTGWAFSTSID